MVLQYTEKQIVAGQFLTTSNTTLYTTPNQVTSLIQKLTVCNTSASSETIDIYLVENGGSVGSENQVIKSKSIAPSETWDGVLVNAHVLEAGGSIVAKASSANAINVIVSGVEISSDSASTATAIATTLTLQDAYLNSSQPQITLDTTRLGLKIIDASTPIGATLFSIENNGQTSKYIDVTSSGIATSGTVSATTQTTEPTNLVRRDYLDGIISSVIDITGTPPGSPNQYDRYIIQSTSGVWSGGSLNDIAEYNGSSWDFYTPTLGQLAYDESESEYYIFQPGTWSPLPLSFSTTAPLSFNSITGFTLAYTTNLALNGSSLDTAQGIKTTDTPTFAGLTLTAALSGTTASLSGLTQGSVLFSGASGLVSQDNSNLNWNDSTNVLTASNLNISSMTSGSVLFSGASGAISQDNSNLYWDDTNNVLGIGTSSPDTSASLHIEKAANEAYIRVGSSGSGRVQLVARNSASGTSYVGCTDSTLGFVAANTFIGYAKSDRFELAKTGVSAGTQTNHWQVQNATAGRDVGIIRSGTNVSSETDRIFWWQYDRVSTTAFRMKAWASDDGAATQDSGFTKYYTGGKMFIGIGGIDSPDRPLVVKSASSGDVFGIQDSGGTTQWHLRTQGTGNGDLGFTESGVADNRLVLKAGGGVTISGTTLDANYHLQLPNSTAQKAKANAWDTYSDMTIKENISDIEDLTDLYKKVRVLRYNFIGQEDAQIGYGAQNMALYFPEICTKNKDGEYTSLDYGKTSAITWSVVKSLISRIETLENRLINI